MKLAAEILVVVVVFAIPLAVVFVVFVWGAIKDGEEDRAVQRLLGLYQGVPLTRRGSYYSGALPDKITIYRGPLERLYGHDPEALRRQVRRVVLHEIAHHFGISDERLIEIDRY